jgi:hypothetical protein
VALGDEVLGCIDDDLGLATRKSRICSSDIAAIRAWDARIPAR